MGKILILDDEQDIVNIISDFVKSEGLMPMKAANAFEALNSLKHASENIDALVIDYKMPVVNGVDFILEARTIKKNLPIIMVSGFAEFRDVEKVHSLGKFWFLDKPIEKPHFISTLKRALAKTKEYIIYKGNTYTVISELNGRVSIENNIGSTFLISTDEYNKAKLQRNAA